MRESKGVRMEVGENGFSNIPATDSFSPKLLSLHIHTKFITMHYHQFHVTDNVPWMFEYACNSALSAITSSLEHLKKACSQFLQLLTNASTPTHFILSSFLQNHSSMDESKSCESHMKIPRLWPRRKALMPAASTPTPAPLSFQNKR